MVCEDDFYREFQSETNLVSELFLNDVTKATPGADIPSYMDRVRSLAASLTGLCTKEKEIFVDRMAGFEKLFTPKSRGAGVYEYKMNIKPHENVVRKTYPVPFAYRERADKEIRKMLNDGAIEY